MSIISSLRSKGEITRSLKIFWVLLATVGFMGFMGSNAVLMASHATHFVSDKGPHLPQNESGCITCHAAGNLQCDLSGPLFADSTPEEPRDLNATTVCDPCHSPGGAFDGVGDLDPGNPDSVAYGAKYNWRQGGVYEEGGGSLKDGKEKWCAGCHDDEPAHSKADGETGVDAPNVVGDNSQVYGYYVSGHGRNAENPVYCHDCHDVTVSHIDHDSQTYVAPYYGYPTYDYRDGYRLSEYMPIPRHGQSGSQAFGLCYKGCHHVYGDQFDPDSHTNFRLDSEGDFNWHDQHAGELYRYTICWDSDWDGTEDSAMSCTACHNVHGSPMDVNGSLQPNPVMIRHGELISTPGTTDKVPALDFHWYKYDNTPVGTLEESRRGGMRTIAGQDISYNHVCWGACHTNPPGGGEITYTRNPGDVAILKVWTTDLNDVEKTEFAVREDIRYHVSFRVYGPDDFFLRTFLSKVYNTSGNPWERQLKKNQTCTAGIYEWIWNRRIPPEATPGSGAEIKMTVKKFEYQGGPLIGSSTAWKTFSIAP